MGPETPSASSSKVGLIPEIDEQEHHISAARVQSLTYVEGVSKSNQKLNEEAQINSQTITQLQHSNNNHTARELEISSQKDGEAPTCQDQYTLVLAGSTSENKCHNLNVGDASRGPLRWPSSFSLGTSIPTTSRSTKSPSLTIDQP
ncbi:hypothetical protein VNO78_10369 [Psophocarpus tetragonolobus]|uniref:Uncharacterized protein n=1 Tax=Psophocarpus tetragonolobus TaxID=3891 RepID=A0AAN9XMG9_PSOTE